MGDAWADTTTSHGRLMLTVLGGLAEFERDLIRARTGEGRERAKARDVKMGRKPKLTPHQQREAIKRRDGGKPVREIARSFNVHHATIETRTAPAFVAASRSPPHLHGYDWNSRRSQSARRAVPLSFHAGLVRRDRVRPGFFLLAARPRPAHHHRLPCYRRRVSTTTTTIDLAEHVIATLRAHEAELRHAGIRRLSLFGSVARGEADAESDVDLAVEFDPAVEMDLIRMVALERRIGEALGRSVEILPEPVENARLRANVERDRQIAF